MRSKVLGSASSPTSPTANTLLAALPADLRAVMKSCTKYTDNKGGGNTASNVSSTTDYLFLLSEYEVFATHQYCNDAEPNYQAQYDYFKAGNSKVANSEPDDRPDHASRWHVHLHRCPDRRRFQLESLQGKYAVPDHQPDCADAGLLL